MNNRFNLLITYFLAGLGMLQAQVDVRVSIENYPSDTALIGSFISIRQEILDTLIRDEAGNFYWHQETELPGGNYFVYMPPKDVYLPFYLDKNDQKGTLIIDFQNIAAGMRSEGLQNTAMFYDYYQKLQDAKKHGKESVTQQKKILQNELFARYPNAIMCKDLGLQHMPMPPQDWDKTQKFYYARAHWFDAIDFSDDRYIRLPETGKKVMHYFQKMLPVNFDSIRSEVDDLLLQIPDSTEMQREVLQLLAHRYKNTGNVTLDKVYRHLIKEHVQNKAFWLSADSLNQLRKDLQIEPQSIGTEAPVVALPVLDVAASSALPDTARTNYVLGEKIAIQEMSGQLKVLLVWDPDCSHCKKEIPVLKSVLDKFKPNAISVMAVCTEYHTGARKCVDMITEKDMEAWTHTIDPYFKERFKQKYHISSTPALFVLDEQNRFVATKIRAEQLEDILLKALNPAK